LAELFLQALLNPNPFRDKLTVTVNAERNMPLNIAITDMMGRKVRSVKYAATAGTNRINIDGLNILSKGGYMLEINSIGEKIGRQTLLKN
jgi:hypothetical protein